MPYADKIKERIQAAPKTLGNQLGRWAVYHDIPVLKISKATGATRQTVYNWLTGGEVTQAYRARVKEILEILRASKTAEAAWRKLCTRFTLSD